MTVVDVFDTGCCGVSLVRVVGVFDTGPCGMSLVTVVDMSDSCGCVVSDAVDTMGFAEMLTVRDGSSDLSGCTVDDAVALTAVSPAADILSPEDTALSCL